MSGRKSQSSALVVVALIMGAAGLGLGMVSILTPSTGVPGMDGTNGIDGTNGTNGIDGTDGTNGTDGKDGTFNSTTENYYFCSNQTELENAITSIGSGAGTIVITKSIKLTSYIGIDTNGDLIIQGVSQGIEIGSPGNDKVFNITAVSSLTIRDLSINISDFTTTGTTGIRVADSNVHLEHLKIYGDSDRNGLAIWIISVSDVWIEDCIINESYYGITVSLSNGVHLNDNSIYNCNKTNAGNGIYLDHSLNSLIHDNYIEGSHSAIYLLASNYTSISSNNLKENRNGINCEESDNNTITGNVILGVIATSGLDFHGIWLNTDADYNVITGNLVTNHINLNQIGYGLKIEDSSIDYSTVAGNTFLNNNVNFVDSGTNTNATGNNY